MLKFRLFRKAHHHHEHIFCVDLILVYTFFHHPFLKGKLSINVFHSTVNSACFCHLLITFANSLEPDQARQNVWPDLDPNFLTLKDCLEKKIILNTDDKKSLKITQHTNS